MIESALVSLVRGRTPVVALPAGVSRALLFESGRQVGSVPVSLLPGRLNVVRR